MTVPHVLVWQGLIPITVVLVLGLNGVISEMDGLVVVRQTEYLRAEPQVTIPVDNKIIVKKSIKDLYAYLFIMLDTRNARNHKISERHYLPGDTKMFGKIFQKSKYFFYDFTIGFLGKAVLFYEQKSQ